MSKVTEGLTIAFYILVIFVCIFGSITWLVFRTKIEQRTFNRCTGSNVSFWEAASTQLRVESCKS